MSTVLKKFSFLSTSEGWTFVSGGSSTSAYSSSVGDPAGSLGMSLTGRKVVESCSWYWAGTWEDLGVIAGSTVTAIKIKSGSSICHNWNTVDTCTIGPVNLLNSLGGHRATLASSRTRTAADADWVDYSEGSNYALNEASTTVNRLEVNAYHDLGNSASAYAETRFDELEFEITFTPPVQYAVFSDTLSLSDDLSLNTPNSLLFDSIGISDSLDTTISKQILFFSDSLSISDNVSEITPNAVFSDIVSLTDRLESFLHTDYLDDSDISPLRDGTDYLTDGSLTPFINFSDDLSLTDEFLLSEANTILSDTIAISDTVLPLSKLLISPSDTIAISDVLESLHGFFIDINDTVSIVDDSSTKRSTYASFFDAVALLDTLSSVAHYKLETADALILSDVEDALATLLSNIDDNTSITDVIQIILSANSDLIESLALSDGILTGSVTSIIDSISLNDEQSILRNLFNLNEDNINLVDAAIGLLTAKINNLDTLNFIDAVITDVYSRTPIDDTLIVTDIIQLGILVSVIDTLSLSDSVQVLQSIKLATSDILSLSDLVKVLINYSENVEESLILADSYLFGNSKSIADSLPLSDFISIYTSRYSLVIDSLQLLDTMYAVWGASFDSTRLVTVHVNLIPLHININSTDIDVNIQITDTIINYEN